MFWVIVCLAVALYWTLAFLASIAAPSLMGATISGPLAVLFAYWTVCFVRERGAAGSQGSGHVESREMSGPRGFPIEPSRQHEEHSEGNPGVGIK